MVSFTIIVNGAPYGNEKVWNALRLATASISSSIGMSVNIFLLAMQWLPQRKDKKTPEGYYNLKKMLRDLISSGAKILACGTCLNSRALTKEDLLDGIEVGTMLKLAGWIKDCSKVLSF